jgi:hypothetical protein
VRLLGVIVSVLGLLVPFLLFGCGPAQEVVAPELKIQNVYIEHLPLPNFRVNWTTTDLATSEIDYGPTSSVTTTFFLRDQNGIGVDCDGHIISEGRTNCPGDVGPIVNTVADNHFALTHSLVGTALTTVSSYAVAITSRNFTGQSAFFTIIMPRVNEIPAP